MLYFGNLMSMVGCVLMVAIGFVRKRERIITLQCFQFGFLGLANLMLGATSGFISGMVSVARNLVFSQAKGGWQLKLLFVCAQLLLTFLAAAEDPISFLPLLAGVLFTCFIDARSDAQLKTVIIAAQILWAVYDACYRNYVALTFDILTICSNLLGIWMLFRSGEFSRKRNRKDAE